MGIIITELANNLVTHAVNAHITVQCLSTSKGDAIEIRSIDCGPGMKDVGKCLLDGFTTAGTPGNGLGAVKRLSDEFDIFSMPEQGTVILSRVLRDGSDAAIQRSRTCAGESIHGPHPANWYVAIAGVSTVRQSGPDSWLPTVLGMARSRLKLRQRFRNI